MINFVYLHTANNFWAAPASKNYALFWWEGGEGSGIEKAYHGQNENGE